jgi:hypothetical protein
VHPPLRPALARQVAHLLCNRKVLRVVLDDLRIVPCDVYAHPRFRTPYALVKSKEYECVKKNVKTRNKNCKPGGGHGKPYTSFTFASGGWGYPPDPH